MASQLRFEGGELEELLERVRNQVGPDARIVAANRIRQGGIGGFFAREGYEVIVDPESTSDDGRAASGRGRRRNRASETVAPASAPTPSAHAEPNGRASASVLDLVDEVITSNANR